MSNARINEAKVLGSTPKFQGRVIRVSVDEVLLPNGHRAPLEIVRHPGGAAAVALDHQDRVCLLRQYRYAANGWVWELPAGKLEPSEPPLRTAQRELLEEAGLEARDWRPLGTSLSSPGVFDEVIHLFLATGLSATAAAPEPNEVLEVHWVAFDAACGRALTGDITDSKTVMGLLRAQHARKSVT